MSGDDRDEMARLRSEYTPMLLRTIAARMQMRVDAILERDRDERVAIEGRGAGISFLFARDIVHALEAGHDEIERQAARIATLEAALRQAQLALDQAQDCILYETPEFGTREDARDDTVQTIRAADRAAAAALAAAAGEGA